MKKYYVREIPFKTVDGDKMKVVKTYESEPKKFDYLIFVKK